MKLFLALILILVAAPALAAPVVSTATLGPNTVTVSGSGFGAKASAPPRFFNNFESATTGQGVAGLTAINAPGGIVSTATVRGSKSLLFQYDTTAGSDIFSKDGIDLGTTPEVTSLYLTMWVLLDKTGTTSSQFQWKDVFLSSETNYYTSTTAGSTAAHETSWWKDPAVYPAYAPVGWFNSYGDVYYNGNNHSISPTSLPNDAHTWGQWERLEFYAQRASGPSVADGKWIINRVGRAGGPLANYTNAVTHIAGDRPWRYLAFGTGVASVYDGEVHLKVYMDDMYVDTTQARVEMCDTSTWSVRTHCEIQPPSAWSDTGITATLNQGSFTAGSTAYLYVVDASGAVSPASAPITLGSTPSTRSLNGRLSGRIR